ncbi:MAG: DNA primase [Firmicutes bacterium]|nr:DNA primase [Bacillota bacterium]
MSFSDSILNEIKNKNDILEVVSVYVSVLKRGKNFIALCPFHAEKTHSFFIYIESSSFYCFGCGAGGDVITFIMLAENLSYPESVKFLAQRVKIDLNLPENTNYNKNTIYEINRTSAKFFHKNLLSDEKMLDYFVKRGLSTRTIKKFGLGATPNNRFGLVNFLKNSNFSEENIISANLGLKSKNGLLIDRFISRVIFPVIDVRGNVIAFGGRSLDDRLPKYINTSDTPVFKKSSNLFALNFAKKENYLILTEGYFDTIALHQLGFTSAISTLGTSLNINQARLISRYTDMVYLCYDSDTAGQKATEKALKILNNENLKNKVISFTDAKDPDEFIKINGIRAKFKFKQLLKNSKNDIEFILNKIKSNLDLRKIEDKVSYLTSASKVISEIEDPIKRDVYSSKICFDEKIQKDVLDMQIDKIVKKRSKLSFRKIENLAKITLNQINNSRKSFKITNLRASYIEELLISCIIKSNDLSADFENLSASDFINDLNCRIFERINQISASGKTIDITSISKDFNLKEIGEISRIANLNSFEKLTSVEIKKYIEILKYEKQIENIKSFKNSDECEIMKFLDKLKLIKR